MLEKLSTPNFFKYGFFIFLAFFLIALIYWLITNTKAAKLHLKNEQTVAQKLEAGELQITTNNPGNDNK